MFEINFLKKLISSPNNYNVSFLEFLKNVSFYVSMDTKATLAVDNKQDSSRSQKRKPHANEQLQRYLTDVLMRESIQQNSSKSDSTVY